MRLRNFRLTTQARAARDFAPAPAVDTTKALCFPRGQAMKIHEYQAKELLAAYGAPVPRGVVASNPEEAVRAFDQLGAPVVLKAQVHAGGRGKGRFKDSGKDWGGVKFIKTRDDAGQHPFQARELAFALGFTGAQVAQAEKVMTALVKVFLDKDCSLAEVNPLVVTDKGEVQVLDAKITFDDNALFRHPDIEKLRDESEENPADLRAAKAGLTYISLNGTIGCLVNGAGLAMSTMDIIKYHGGEPANFLDVGGGVTPEGAIEAFRILLSDPRVKGVLVNIFGGIAECDLIAEALGKAGREVGYQVPVRVRLARTTVEKPRD